MSYAGRKWLLDELPASDSGEAALFRAPGRVNIIGEHTDYTGGLVLPTATAAYIWAAACARDDRQVCIKSLNFEESQTFSLDDLEPGADPDWADYAKGVAALLQRNDIALRGVNIVIDSDIPIGGGLSSSAAFEVVVATALLEIASARMPAPQLARLCQQAEIEFVGLHCGVMDQFASACCERGHALLLDCRSFEYEHVPLPETISFLVTDSGVRHALPEGDYNQRAQECGKATEILSQHISRLVSLRDLSLEDLEMHRNTLGDRLYRRSHHVVSENQRVLDATMAVRAADIEKLGKLISTSHRSLRDDFEASCAAVDTLVEIADTCDGVYGSRMIGGGFGGCVLSVVETANTERVMAKIKSEFQSAAGELPWMHIVSPADAASKVSYP